jgi:hypothetical protein
MAKTPGEVDIDVGASSSRDVSSTDRELRRAKRSLNSLAPRKVMSREDKGAQAPSRGRNEKAGKRGRSDEMRMDGSSQEAATNSIRPTQRRIRAAGHEAMITDGRAYSHEGRNSSRAVPEEIKQRFVQVGNKYHFPDGARAFTDHGNRLTSPSENSEVIKSLISIAQARGWSDITVSGTERFRKEAWFAARLAGLKVRGYTPTEFEQGRLIRNLARESGRERTAPAATATSGSVTRLTNGGTNARDPGDTREARVQPRERQRTLQVGRLVDHGAAPYLHDPQNATSYFVRIETQNGERDVWGVDLQRALKESLTRPQVGDEIGIRALRRDAVKVSRPELDADGRVIGKKELETHRNAWVVEKREFFRERAQAARILRDTSLDRQAAVRAHPELLGTYLQLHAAELAAKTLRSPEDQRRFVASVREALADSVARGEPLPPVPLKEPARSREARAPAPSERNPAPTR